MATTLSFLRVLALASVPTLAYADCTLVWQTGWRNDTLGGSHINSIENLEVADDFDFTGALGRIVVNGYGASGVSVPIDGVWVRFYQWTANGPGALQSQRFLAASDPNLHVLAAPQTLDIVLAQPFQATGKHFMSIQVDFAPDGIWWPWIGGDVTPHLSRAWVRDNLGAQTWGPFINGLGQVVDADMSFTLYGAATGSTCAAWTDAPTPLPNPERTLLTDVDVIAANDAWAVGEYQSTTVGSSEQFTLAMHWDGAAWTTTPTPSPMPAPGMSNDYLWAVAALGHNDVWAGGEQNMQVNGGWVGSQPLALHWDGSAWTEVPTPIPPTSIGAGYTGSSIQAIEAISANDLWFLGRWIGPYPGTTSTQPAMAMHWDGSSITLAPTPVLAGSQVIHAVDSSGPNDVWALGSMSSPQTQYPYVVHWNGAAWSQVLIPPAGVTQDVVDISVLAPNDVWVLAVRNVGTGTGNFLMHYNGTGWTQSAAPILGRMFATAANDMWIAGSQLEHFDGSAWSVVDEFSCFPSATFAAIDGGGGSLWAVGGQMSAAWLPLTVHTTGQSCSAFSYCTSSTTSSGCVPTMSSLGAASASASSGFTLRVDHVEGQKQGILFYGVSGQHAAPWASGSTSVLCVKAPLQRMTSQQSGGLIFQCNGVLSQDWNAFMATHPAALGNPRAVGQTFDAQGWFRDPPAAKTTNLSNGYEFVVQP
jgi:hypothetical protein